MIVYFYAILALSALAACEFAYGVLRRTNTFELRDTVSSAGTAILSISLKMVTRGVEVGIYAFLLGKIALVSLDWHHPAMIALAVVLYDLCYYWRHRVSHTVNLFWAIHAVHHQSRHLNLTTSFRQYSFGFLTDWIFVVPLALLGMPVEVFILALFVDLLYQFWVHTQHIGRVPVIEGILVTPAAHRLHHAVNEPYQNTNFGGIFVLWDRMFGSYAVETEPPEYGILPRLESWNPVLANLQIPAILWRHVRTSDAKRLPRILFGHPRDLDYSGAPLFAPAPGGEGYQRYSLAATALTVAFLLPVLLHFDAFAFADKVAAAAFVWFSLFCGIGILDGRTYLKLLCLMRPAIAAPLLLLLPLGPVLAVLAGAEAVLAAWLAARLWKESPFRAHSKRASEA